MRSRSVTIFSAVVMKRRSDATGWRVREDAQAQLVDLDLEPVDLAVDSIVAWASSLSRSTSASHAVRDHLLDLRAHEQQLLAQRAQLGLVLAVGVLRGIAASASVSRTGR